MKMELKNPVTQLENSKKNFTNRMNYTEDRIPVLKDKVEDLDKIIRKSEKLI